MHTNPYHGEDVYGHGPLLFFVSWNRLIFGNVCGVLFLVASLGYIGGRIFIKERIKGLLNFERLAIWGSVLIYVTAHSIFWYKGLFGSAGMWRVMAAISPAFALLSMRGMTIATGWLEKFKLIYNTIWIAVICLIIYYPVRSLDLPQRLNERKSTVRKACEWVKQNHLLNHKIYYSEPFTKMCLSLDPFGETNSKELMYVDRQNVGSDIPSGAILIWEAGLGPNEDQIPLVKLQDTSKFIFLQKFEAPYEMERGAKYAAYVFERK